MKKSWISLLLALCFTLSTMIGVMAETNDEIDLAIDYEEMNINTELGDLDISQEDELELSTLRNLDDSIVLDDTLNEYNMLQADAPVRSNSFTDGDYDHDAFEINNKGVLVEYRGDGGDVVIPDGVTGILGAFWGCDNLTSISIPNSVTWIGSGAFGWCDHLSDIVIPNSVKSIGDNAFIGCDSLIDITIPKGVETIERDAFPNCGRLKSVTISSSVTSIGNYAFDECEKLMIVTILGNTLKLGKGIFEDCPYNLTIYTVSNSCVAEWAQKTGYKVVDNLLLLNKNTSKKLNKGEKAQIVVENTLAKSYISSNKNIATVSEEGLVSAIQMGTAKITVTLSNNKKRVLTVKVPDPALISDTTLSLDIGNTHMLKVSGLEGRTVTWSSSNDKVATVQKGKVTAKKIGKCTITAKLSDGKKLTCKVTVTDPAKLSKTSLSLIAGKTSTLTVSGLKGRTVTWSSSNKKVATVDSGKVTAVAAGQCKIIAKVGNTKLTCKVTVTKPLTGDIHGILGKNMNSINKRLPDKLRYYDDDAYTNDYFLVQTDDSNDIISIALLTDAETDIGKYSLYGLYPGMSYDKACKLLSKRGWKLDSESYDKSYFYNPKDSNVSFYVTIIDDEIDLIVYMYI